MKRLLSILGVILAVAGIGFWLRPLSYINGFTYLGEALSGVQTRTVLVDDYRVNYEVEGPRGGPPVVLVHGLGGSADGWRALAPYLKHAGFRVYMPDLVGYGRSQKPSNFSYSVHDEAAIVVGFLDALGLKRVDLGGWSMGGWIVQLVAATNPERVKHLILFDSAGLREAPTWDTHLFTPTNLNQLGQLDALLTPDPPRIPRFVGEDILRVSNDSGWVIHRALNQMWTAQDVTDHLLPKLTMPVLIEWGAEDRVIPLDQARRIHQLIPNSQLDVHNGCGHLAPLLCAKEIGPSVVNFVRGAPPVPPTKPEKKHPTENTLGSSHAIATTAPAGD